MRVLILIFYFFIFCSIISSQEITKDNAVDFLNLVCSDTAEISAFFNPEEIILSERLGIEYKGVKNKFLIGNELPKNIKISVLNNENKTIDIIKTGEKYSELLIRIPSQNFEKIYYLKEGKIISPALYHSKNWEIIDTKYIKFVIQNNKITNKYAMSKLNDFVEELCSLLKIQKIEKELLEREKIYYFLCNDQNEIEKLTGYKSLGMCNLAFDYIISTYNSHYHELSHIMINFKLKKTYLYTHPFFQEGFAVSFGGRGGLSRDLILRTGSFILDNFVSYEEYLNINNFIKEDASFTYPVSGLYNAFLISRIGIENYLKLYMEYSYSLDSAINQIKNEFLPEKLEFAFYKDSLMKNLLVKPLNKQDSEIDYFNNMAENDSVNFLPYKSNYYIFKSPSSFVIYSGEIPGNFESKKYNEKKPGKIYDGCKYLIAIEKSEISVYNLYINNLLANYSLNFENNLEEIRKTDGNYYILINKKIFDENDKDFKISIF